MFDFQGTLQDLLTHLSLIPKGLNWLDYIILLVFVLYAFEGFGVGFLAGLFDLVSFLFSFIFALKFYTAVGMVLYKLFSIPVGFSNAFGFFAVAFISEIVLSILLRKLFHFLSTTFAVKPVVHKRSDDSASILHIINQLLGVFPGVASAYILLAFLLTIILALPFSPSLKKIIVSSSLGNKLAANTQGFEKNLNDVFGGAIQETLNFLTVEPQSSEIVKLNFTTSDVTIDFEAEQQMFEMVNSERTKIGLSPLTFDPALQEVAREHSKDMFARGYFSHFTPDGQSPFDRMAQAGITYQYAGENLALAPSTQIAMQGLMASPGHKANILSANYGRVGIGVVDGGIYGKMFSQEFRD